MITTTIVVTLLIAALMAASPRFSESFYRRMIFAPVKVKLEGKSELGELSQPEKISVSFKSGKNTLHAMLYRRPGSCMTALFSHSNWGNIHEWQRVCEQLLSCNLQVFAYDYAGFGASSGKPSVKGICSDGLAAFDYLVNVEKIPSEQIVLFGGSLGTGVSCDISVRRKCAGIILHASFSSLRNLVIDMLPITRFLPQFLFFKPRLDNCAALKNSSTPLLLLHGDKDEMCAPRHAQALLAASKTTNKKLVLLPGAGHMQTRSEGKLFENSIISFLQSL